MSIAASRDKIPHRAYADAVLSELERRAAWVGPRKLRSIFFGGGTPSLWEPRELGRVIEAIRAAFSCGDEVEITAECNPSSFDARRAEALIAAGVNRVSIGVQSLHEGRLGFLGRLHNAEQGLAAVKCALAAGLPRVSADLIFGVHGQSRAEAEAEARTVADLGLTHMSLYALTIEDNTQFGTLHRKGQLQTLDEDIAARMFDGVGATLEQCGFTHYEISNFAREGHVAAHNLIYWRGGDYLGLGVGAWGTVNTQERRIRYRNTPAEDRYMAAGQRWQSIDLERMPHGAERLQSAVEILEPEVQLRERIMLGLRLDEGLDLERAAREVGAVAFTPERRQALERLTARKRVAHEGGRLWIPKDAWLFADGTIAELM